MHTPLRPRAAGPGLALLALLTLLSGCAAPIAGTWQGTLDVGPLDAPELQLVVAEDGKSGRLVAREAGRAFSAFQICSLRETGPRAYEIVYDARRPDCADKGNDPSERRTLRATAGEQVVYGELFQGEQRLGFFRAFRQPDATVPPSPAGPPAGAAR